MNHPPPTPVHSRLVRIRLVGTLCLLLLLAFSANPARSQLHAAPQPSHERAPRPSDAPVATGLSLNLCVEGSATYPCPDPVTLDGVYIPQITQVYGQVLDGVVVFSPGSLTSGTIILYKDDGTGPAPICVLSVGVTRACPANSTVFDVGTYTLTATLTFPESSAYAASSAAPVVVTITQDTAQIALSSSPNPSAFGSPVTLAATATGGFAAVPTGQVTFLVDNAPLDPVPLDSTGRAVYTTSTLPIGIHDIVATYPGSRNFLAAADTPALKQQVEPPATSTTLSSNLNPSAVGDKVIFTATVSTAAGFTGTPGGQVVFRDGNVVLQTSPVAQKNGQFIAQANTSTLAFGSHSITANYLGDSATSPSLSPVYVQQVNHPLSQLPPGFRITVSPSPVVLGIGQKADLTVTVTPISGFAQPVTLSCSSLPNEAACTFEDSLIPAGGGKTSLSFTTTAPHDCGSSEPYFTGHAALRPPPTWRDATPLLAFVVLLIRPRRRRPQWTLFTIAVASSLIVLNGCGGTCTDFGTKPGSYTFKVNGTAASAPSTSSSSSTASTSVALSIKL